jgi:hypothetical protein
MAAVRFCVSWISGILQYVYKQIQSVSNTL